MVETVDDPGGRAGEPHAMTERSPSTAPPPESQRAPPSSKRLAFPSVPPPAEAHLASESLHTEEVGRARLFFLLAFGLNVLVLLLVPLLGGPPGGRQVVLYTLVPAAMTTGWLSWRLRDGTAYPLALAALGAVACEAGALASIYYFGVFSPAVIVLPIGLFFFGTALDERMQLGAYATVAAAYFALAAMVIRRAVPEQGVVSGPRLSPTQELVLVVLVEAVLLVAFVNARATRAATLIAVARHDRVVRGLMQREALLHEARQDLARALDFAGLGRFSDTTVGSFHLGSVIGRGAMGEVYEGTHAVTKAPAAVKLLHPHVLRDPNVRRRFLREAEIAASLDVPNVVRVLEIGGFSERATDTSADSELPYIAMERLQGEDLAEKLRRTQHLSVDDVLNLIAQIGRGLSAARAAGIVHRDLKPRNLFLAEASTLPNASKGGAPAPGWKILDFGVSKLMSHDSSEETQDRIVGTPEYMAPEQAAGRELSHRTDLFSLAIIAYRALTGVPAFSGDHIAEILYQVAHTMPERPSSVAELSPDVDLVLAIALAKLPADRFDSAEELGAALEAASRGALTPSLRGRASRLLERHPWGHGRQA